LFLKKLCVRNVRQTSHGALGIGREAKRRGAARGQQSSTNKESKIYRDSSFPVQGDFLASQTDPTADVAEGKPSRESTGKPKKEA